MHYNTFAWLKAQQFKFLFPAGAQLATRWTDDTPFPPLPPREAAALALAFVDDRLPDCGRTLRAISLRQAWGPEPLDVYWYYTVELLIPDLEDFGDAELVQIPVLMDGRVPRWALVTDADEPVPGPGEL